MLQVAMLSKWHVHAEDYARQLSAMPDVKIVAVWDEDAQRGAEWAARLGVDFEADLDACLARSDVQGVVVDTPTNMHPNVMIRAAKAGKHIFTEKVMATTLADAQKICDAVREAGVQFVISFPQRTWPETLYIRECIEKGLLGEVTLIRAHNTHAGALQNWLPEYWYDPIATGGGAMMDLGAHPMYLSNWLLGKPKSIQSTFSYRTGRKVEDDALCVITFECGAVALVETSLVNPHASNSLEVYGTQGAVLLREGELLLRSDKLPEDVQGWLKPAKLPQRQDAPIRQWVDAILQGKACAFDLEAGMALTQLMEGAYRAHAEGKTVQF